jgi:hypothetical protein
MPEKDQMMMFNTDELSLLKNTFADNHVLLYTIRKVFLQFPLTDVEKGLIRQAVTPAVFDVLKKRMLPELSPVYPLGQLPSILTTLTDQLRAKDAEEMRLQFEAKKLEIVYLTQQFNKLKDLDAKETVKLSDMALLVDHHEVNYINMTAYLFILGYVDPSLLFIKSLAGEKAESPEAQKKRLSRDSSK